MLRSLTSAANFSTNSGCGKPARLGASVSKYKASDSNLANYGSSQHLIGARVLLDHLVYDSCGGIDECGKPTVVHGDCCEACQGNTGREWMLCAGGQCQFMHGVDLLTPGTLSLSS